jgi:predicted HAD superfamily Cof-like phosphohydrolase
MSVRSVARLGISVENSSLRRPRPTFHVRDPAEEHGAPCAQHRAQPENRQTGAFREIVDFAPAAAPSENEFRNLVCAVQQVVGKVV